MRILEIINTFDDVGGAEILLRDLCMSWKASGLDVSIYLLTSRGGPLEIALEKNGVRIIKSGSRSAYSPLQVFHLATHFRRSTYDVVHSHLFPSQLWTVLASLLCPRKFPLVTTEHTTTNRRRIKVLRRLEQLMYESYSRIACISIAAKDSLDRWLSRGHGGLRVIPNGVEIRRFSALAGKTAPLLDRSGPILLCVGQLIPRKNQILLIRALSLVSNAVLYLVGDGKDRQRLGKAAADLGVSARVHFLGFRSDIADLLRAADVYIQPSLEDGFCIAALEAMCAGAPVIASAVPGLGDVVGEAGLLFPSNDLEALADAINRLLRDDGLRRKLAELGRRRAQDFTIEHTAALYLTLFEEAVGIGKASRTRIGGPPDLGRQDSTSTRAVY